MRRYLLLLLAIILVVVLQPDVEAQTAYGKIKPSEMMSRERPWYDCTHPVWGMECDYDDDTKTGTDDTAELQDCIDAATDEAWGMAYIGACKALISSPIVVTGPLIVAGCGSGIDWEFWSDEAGYTDPDRACTQIIMDDTMAFPQAAFVVRGAAGTGRGYMNDTYYYGSEGVEFRDLLIRAETENDGGSCILLDGTLEDGKDCDNDVFPDSCSCTPGGPSGTCRAAVRDVAITRVNCQHAGGACFHQRGNVFDVSYDHAAAAWCGHGGFLFEHNSIWQDGTDCTGTCKTYQTTIFESFAWGCDRDSAYCVDDAGYCTSSTTIPCYDNSDCPGVDTCTADITSPFNAWAAVTNHTAYAFGLIQGDFGWRMGWRSQGAWPVIEGENDVTDGHSSDDNIGVLMDGRHISLVTSGVTAFERCIQIGRDGSADNVEYTGHINLLQQCGDPGYCGPTETTEECNEDEDCSLYPADTCVTAGDGFAIKVEDGGPRTGFLWLGKVLLNYWPGDNQDEGAIVDDRCAVDGAQYCNEALFFPVGTSIDGDAQFRSGADFSGPILLTSTDGGAEITARVNDDTEIAQRFIIYDSGWVLQEDMKFALTTNNDYVITDLSATPDQQLLVLATAGGETNLRVRGSLPTLELLDEDDNAPATPTAEFRSNCTGGAGSENCDIVIEAEVGGLAGTEVARYTASTDSWAFNGLSAAAGGDANDIQYNIGGALTGESAFEYDPATNTQTVDNISLTDTMFSGATDGGGTPLFYFDLNDVADPTTDPVFQIENSVTDNEYFTIGPYGEVGMGDGSSEYEKGWQLAFISDASLKDPTGTDYGGIWGHVQTGATPATITDLIAVKGTTIANGATNFSLGVKGALFDVDRVSGGNTVAGDVIGVDVQLDNAISDSGHTSNLLAGVKIDLDDVDGDWYRAAGLYIADTHGATTNYPYGTSGIYTLIPSNDVLTTCTEATPPLWSQHCSHWGVEISSMRTRTNLAMKTGMVSGGVKIGHPREFTYGGHIAFGDAQGFTYFDDGTNNPLGLAQHDGDQWWSLVGNINEFTADATPDPTTDYVVTYDASEGSYGGQKKVLLQNIFGVNLTWDGTDQLTLDTNSTTAAKLDLQTTAGHYRLQQDNSGIFSLKNQDGSGDEYTFTGAGAFQVESDDPCYKMKDDSNTDDEVSFELCGVSTDTDTGLEEDVDVTLKSMVTGVLTTHITVDADDGPDGGSTLMTLHPQTQFDVGIDVEAGEIDMSDTSYTCATSAGRGQVYTKDVGSGVIELHYCDEGTTEVQITDGGALKGAGGETNTASNLGAGIGVYETKSGVDLQFNSLIGAAGIDIAEDDANDEIDISTKSSEEAFLIDGGATSFTCGASTGGSMQVMDDGDLEWCDGAATPGLQSVDAKIAAISIPDIKSGEINVTEGTPGTVTFNTAFSGTPWCTCTLEQGIIDATCWISTDATTTSVSFAVDNSTGGNGTYDVNWICTDAGDP
jgi:hypothetical protein